MGGLLRRHKANKRATFTPSRHLSSTVSSRDEEFFKHTARRFIFNEEARLRERYVKFNVSELQRIAAHAVDRDRCTGIFKMAEGGFNKVFLLTMNDGHEVIARIPTPIAGPRHFSTASEVATLDFLRNVLDLPVPRVYAYSATDENSVGAEYILMERIHGESLASRWLSLSTVETRDVMAQLVDVEQKISSYDFPAYGSLYYKNDIAKSSQIDLKADGFCLGPICKRQFWHDEREQMRIDRGPWTDPEACVSAAARREIACLTDYAKPQPRRTFLLPTGHDIEPSEHISLLSQFLSVAPFLIPKDAELSAPTLRHPDLSLPNILLVPGSTKLLSIIDWQDAAILPFFMQAGYPAFCEHELSRPQSMTKPTLPENFDNLGPAEQQLARVELRLEQANLYYTAATGLNHARHFKALRLRNLHMRQYLISQTGFPWDADLINLRAALVGITKVWDDISPGTPCPISFAPSEEETALSEAEEWNESAALLSTVRNSLHIDEEGGTEPKNYDYACHMMKQWQLEMMKGADEGERELCWRNMPYKDDDAEPLKL